MKKRTWIIGGVVVLAVASVGCGYAVQQAPLLARLGTYLAISLAYPLAGLLLLMRSEAERERMRILIDRLRLRKRVLGQAGQS